MTDKEKLTLMEEILDVDEGSLSPENLLGEFEEWDSLAGLVLVSTVDEKFHRTVTTEELKNIKTVADAMELMRS